MNDSARQECQKDMEHLANKLRLTTEATDLAVRLALGLEVGTALTTAHGKAGQLRTKRSKGC